MIIGRKIYITYLVVLLLLASYILPPIQFAKANENADDASAHYYVVQDTVAVQHGKSHKAVGELVQNTLIKAAHIRDGNVYFQWGTELAYVQFERAAPSSVPEVTEWKSYPDNELPLSYIQANEKIEIKSADQKIIGYLLEGNTYPILQELESSYEIILANQLAYIPKNSSVILIEESDPENIKLDEQQTVQENVNQSTEPPKDAPSSEQSPTKDGKTSVTTTQPVNITKQSITIASNSTEATFTVNTKYFKVTTDALPIYDNSTGALVKVGYLEKGQEFPRVKDYGNWHQIQFGNKYAYVLKAATVPSDGKTLLALNSKPNQNLTFTAMIDVVVYDNSTGSLVPFGVIQKGQAYPILRDFGNWYEVALSDRIGYVHKSGVRVDFKSSDRYFRVMEDQLGIYDNSTGKLVKVGALEKGQEYPRVRDYGNWHQIKYGKGYAYVSKAATVPSNGSNIKNLNTISPSSRTFTAISDLPVYDNSSGSLVKFATIPKGMEYPILKDYGNWYMVDVSGRLGYVHKSGVKIPFTSTHRYFEVIEDNAIVYTNSSGRLLPVAVLEKGQLFPRIRDYGNWHEIKFGKSVAYVWKGATRPPFSINLKNENNGLYNPTDRSFLTLADTPVYENLNGTYVRFATLNGNQSYPIISENGNWVQIDIAGRIGYVNKENLQIGPIFRFSHYNLTLQDMLNIQMTRSPQTDKYRNDKSYVHSQYIQLEKPNTFPTKGTVTASTLNVREGAGTNYWVVGTLKSGQTVNVLAQVGDWYEIQFGPWKNAKPEDVITYLDPNNFTRDSKEYFQFLLLSESAGVPVSELNNKILVNKGILAGKGQAFIDAGLKYNINEIYLISHALLETGNGTSSLAKGILVSSVNGVPVEPKVVYNMYGIAAYDHCPTTCGAEYAYKQGWFTPEAAIIGGAEYIASSYIHHPTYKQDTLYKMRWNPGNPGIHQYATDIGWAVKQVRNISQLYDLLDTYTLIFDVPVYR